MASSNSTNHLNRESSSPFLYLKMSSLQDFGSTRVHRLGNSSLCLRLSQQFELLRTLLVKQGYFLPWLVKFMLYEPGDGGILLTSVQCVQHGTDGMFSDGRTQSFDRTPFDVTQLGVAFTHGVKVVTIIFQHVHVECEDCGPGGLQSATRCNGALVNCTDEVQVNLHWLSVS